MIKKITMPLIKDICLMLSVALFLFIVFLLPLSIKEQLMLVYATPLSLGLFFTSFVHVDVMHFLGNLSFYLIFIFTIYMLAVSGKVKRDFYAMFFAAILLLPLVLSVLDIVVMITLNLGGGRTYGFSGIDSFFLGVLPYFAIANFKRAWPESNMQTGSYVFLFFVMGSIALLFNAGVLILLLPWIFFFIFLALFLKPKWGEMKKGFDFFKSKPNKVVVCILLLVLLVLGSEIYGLFPSVIVRGDTRVDILTHYLGLALGLFAGIFLSWHREKLLGIKK